MESGNDDDDDVKRAGSKDKKKKKKMDGKKRKGGGDGGGASGKRDPAKLLEQLKATPGASYEEEKIPGFNMAGRPDNLLREVTKLKKVVAKVATPYHQTNNLGTDSYIHFVIRSSKNEWVRFKSDSLTLVVYGSQNNVARNPAVAADQEQGAVRHSLRARAGNPAIWIDPSVMGTGFVSRVDVSIDNVPVPTNNSLGGLLQHYTRMSRVFVKTPGSPVVARSSQINFAGAEQNKQTAAATYAFDNVTWNAQDGVRIPVYLDGIFPFSFRNRSLESMSRQKEPNLFFPPDVTIEVKVHMHRSKMESIFHPNIPDIINYFDVAAANAPANDLRFTILSAELEYEAVELTAEEHTKSMKQYLDGGAGYYDYDIPRGQHQALAPGVSYTENVFQIMPFAKLAYIAFLPDWATFVMENRRKPLSCFSRFPLNCTRMRVGFAGNDSLLADSFDRFGVRGERHQVSKKIYYQYLKKNRLT